MPPFTFNAFSAELNICICFPMIKLPKMEAPPLTIRKDPFPRAVASAFPYRVN